MTSSPRVRLGSLAAMALIGTPMASAALLVSDGFNYPTTTTGQGLTDASAGVWNRTGSAGNDVGVITGSLPYGGAGAPPALPGDSPTDSFNNSAQLFGSGTPSSKSGVSDRITLSTTGGITTGSIYYSFTMKATSVTNFGTSTANGITTTGSFLAGFNNATGSNAAVLATAGGALVVHRDPTDGNKYQLGIAQNQAPTTLRVFDTAHSYSTSDTLFVVGEYTFAFDPTNSATVTDFANLYVFPNSTAVSQTEPGTPTATSGGTSAVALNATNNQISSFFFRNNSLEPDGLQVDDLRIGTSYADVIGVVATPEPAAAALLGLAAPALIRRRRKR